MTEEKPDIEAKWYVPVPSPEFQIHGDPAPLFAALANAQGMFEQPKKTKKVVIRSSKGQYDFDYAPLDEILRATRDGLRANGLSICQPFSKGEGGSVVHTILAHSSGARLEARVVLPEANDIKGFGSNLTYIRRYQIASILGVAADDDDDGSAGTGDHVAQRAATPPKSRKARTPPAPKEEKAAPAETPAPSNENGEIQDDTRAELMGLMKTAGLNRATSKQWIEHHAGKPKDTMSESDVQNLIKVMTEQITERGENWAGEATDVTS